MLRRSWASTAIQGGLLTGVGLAFFGGPEPPQADAAPLCYLEGQCKQTKPLFMIVVDYSTAMNQPFSPQLTRWEATVDAVQEIVGGQNGYLQASAFIGLMRFGHDPLPGAPGTTIAGDASQPPLVDGQSIDVPFYDASDPNKAYYHCNGDALRVVWDPQLGGVVPAPLGGQLAGIERWTRGALDRAYAAIQQSWADHPGELTKRPAAVLLITGGAWTDPAGEQSLAPANQDPALAAGAMFDAHAVPTYVIALGEAKDAAFADTIAAAGGTGEARDVGGPVTLSAAAASVADDVARRLMPSCATGRPRLMVLLDASSSMLNILGGTQFGNQGETGWDQVRSALAGNMSLFDLVIGGNKKIEGVVDVGLAVFGHNLPAPGEQKLVVDYGPCRKENVAWALDPSSSCAAPGCFDPWGGPPNTWTFQDASTLEPPLFTDPTISHMPRCDLVAQLPMACFGSGTYTHLGLQLVAQNLAAYKAKCSDPKAEQPCDAATPFVNVLITDGVYGSTDTQVKVALEGMFAAGVTTRVIGFGDAVGSPTAVTQLTNMAAWGSGGVLPYFKAPNQQALWPALTEIVEAFPVDPCCLPYDCLDWQGCVCGDGVVEGCGFGDPWLEECDDGNNLDGDGCDATCHLEPVDTSTGADMTTTSGGISGGSSSGSSSGEGASSGGSSSSSSSGSASSSSSSGEVVTTGGSVTDGGSGGGSSEGAGSTGEVGGGEDGCGCASGGGRGALLGLPLLALVWRRRARARGGR